MIINEYGNILYRNIKSFKVIKILENVKTLTNSQLLNAITFFCLSPKLKLIFVFSLKV